MEEKDEKLCTKVLQTLKEMMDVDPHFDDRLVELIMSNPRHLSFVKSVELGIALLEGGNSTIQKSIYQKLTLGNNSEKFSMIK